MEDGRADRKILLLQARRVETIRSFRAGKIRESELLISVCQICEGVQRLSLESRAGAGRGGDEDKK